MSIKQSNKPPRIKAGAVIKAKVLASRGRYKGKGLLEALAAEKSRERKI